MGSDKGKASGVRLDRRPILVGESNPYGAEPYFALYPHPVGSSGHRLATAILWLSRQRYLDLFRRVNLCAGVWSLREARAEAERIDIEATVRRTSIVLLGSKVCAAFGVKFEPFSESVGWGWYKRVVLPHPSRRCRLWLERGSYTKARELVLPLIREIE